MSPSFTIGGDTSSEPEVPDTGSEQQELHPSASRPTDETPGTTEFTTPPGIVLEHLDPNAVELVKKAFTVQLPEWIIQKVRHSQVAVEAHETVLRALSSFSTPYGELILAEDINKEILFNAMSDTINTTIPPIRKADDPLLDDLLGETTPIDLVLMQEELSQTLRIAFPFILASCHTVNDLMRSMFNLKDDYAWRKPVDNLVELAFMGGGGINEVETGLELEVVYNTLLAAPISTFATQAGSFPHLSSTSDTSVLTPKYDFFSSQTSSPLSQNSLSSLRLQNSALLNPLLMDLHILQFVVEFEHEPIFTSDYGERLMNHLGTAQYQRRMLGFSDHSIYGVAVSKGIATAFVSWWELESLSNINVSEVAKFDLSIPLACVRFFIFLTLVKQDIEATYHADLRWLELEDVVEVQGETGSGIGLNGWRYSGRDWEDEANGGEDEDFGSEGDKQCPDGEEIGTGDVDEEEVTVQYQRENEESLGLPSAGNEEEGTEEVPFVRRLADLVMQMEFPPHPNALYNKYIIDRETAIRALLAQPDSDDEDGDEEENDEVDFPVHYALLSTPPPRLTSQSTPHPHIKHNTTSEFLMSNIQTWTAWEKESLDYGGAQARFIHDLCFGECGAHGHAGEDEDEDGKSGEGVDSLFAGLSALD